MSKSDIKWKVVEEIAESVFYLEYKATTRKQRERMELRISEGLPPVEIDPESGGMHQGCGISAENMGMILSALSIIVSWYTWSHPKPQKTDYQGFLTFLKENPKAMQSYTEMISKEIERIIENKFEPILHKLDEISKEVKKR